MGNLFLSVPAPAYNGSGAAVDFTAFGFRKTFVIGGVWTLPPTINIEIHNDPVATDGGWQSIATSQGSTTVTVGVACRWIRVSVANFRGGMAPVVNVGGDDSGTNFAQLIAPPGNGIGAAVDVSSLGKTKSIHVSSQFRGTAILEISTDGGATWAQQSALNGPGLENAVFTADFMRVRRRGAPQIDPGLPVINIGAAEGGAGTAGASAYQIAVANGFVGTEAQWLASLIGSSGAPGSDGADGEAGAPGPAGSAGADGSPGLQGAPGVQGDQGPPGDPGDPGPPGIQGATGSSGAPGTPGADGADGENGPPGAAGVAGATGPAGADGATGPTGMAGPQGDPGFDGDPGSPGLPGATGPQGLAGSPGVDGIDGADGPPGPPGVAGATGPAGADGAVGSQGVPGAEGAPGQDGDLGPPGPPGGPGVDGATGIAGPMGVAGPPGPEGQPGDDGQPGPPGPTGATGAAGGSGTSGTAILDFTANPQRAVVTVTGQAAISAGSAIRPFMMGDTTATHNAYEHAMVPLVLSCGNIVAGVGFDIVAVCEWKLHGTFVVHWTY